MIDTIKLNLDLPSNKSLEAEIYKIQNRKTRLVSKDFTNDIAQKIARNLRHQHQLEESLGVDYRIKYNKDWDLKDELGLDTFRIEELKKTRKKIKELEHELDEYAYNVRDIKTNFIINYAKQTAYGGITQATISAPSHTYDVHINVNQFSEEITIEFSVPKYLYGTNLFEFLPDSRGVYFHRSSLSYEHHLRKLTDITHSRLLKVIHYFFRSNFEAKVDYRTCQIQRIDFCTQQYFQNQSQVKEITQQLKKIDKKYKRLNSTHYSYDTTPVYVPSSYTTFKIYEKHNDFIKHDKKKMLDNSTLWTNEQIDTMEAVSKKVMRYETEFRNAGMNEIYNQTILKKVEGFEEYKKQHKQIKAISNWKPVQNLLIKKGKKEMIVGKLWNDIPTKYRTLFRRVDLRVEAKGYYYSYINILKPLKTEFEKYEKWLTSKRFKFCVSAPLFHDKISEAPNKVFLGQEKPSVLLFDKELFYQLAKKHFANMNEYKLESRNDVDTYVEMIKKFNKNKTSKASKMLVSRLKLAISIMDKDKISLQQYRREYELPDSTFYRLKKDLKAIGYGTTTSTERKLYYPIITPLAYYDNIEWQFRDSFKKNYVSLFDTKSKVQKKDKIKLY